MLEYWGPGSADIITSLQSACFWWNHGQPANCNLSSSVTLDLFCTSVRIKVLSSEGTKWKPKALKKVPVGHFDLHFWTTESMNFCLEWEMKARLSDREHIFKKSSDVCPSALWKKVSAVPVWLSWVVKKSFYHLRTCPTVGLVTDPDWLAYPTQYSLSVLEYSGSEPLHLHSTESISLGESLCG